jgi:hypothetical protein
MTGLSRGCARPVALCESMLVIRLILIMREVIDERSQVCSLWGSGLGW